MLNISSDMPEEDPKNEAQPENPDKNQQEEQDSGSESSGGDIEQQKVQEEEIPDIKSGRPEKESSNIT